MSRAPAFKLLALAAAGLAVLATAGSFPGAGREEPRSGGRIRIRDRVPASPPSLDPATSSWTFPVQQIFEGLVRLDSRLELAPSLAEYWMISEDGRRMSFILKRGVRFHHGRDLEALDVKASLERVLRRETRSPHGLLLAARVAGGLAFRDGLTADVAGFRVPEKYVFEVTWNGPAIASLYLLSMSFCAILPRDRLAEEGSGFFDKPSGTGAFRFASWIRSPKLDIVGVSLERFPGYHGRKAYLDVLEYSPHFTVDQFMAGDVDVLPFQSERMANSGCQAFLGGPYAAAYLTLSCHRAPFDRPAVRRAVASAIDRDRLIEALRGPDKVRRPTASFLPSGLPGFPPPEEVPVFEPERARRLLEELGYSAERPFPAVFLFAIGPRSDTATRSVRTIAAQLAAAGIRAEVRSIRSVEDLGAVLTPYLALTVRSLAVPDADGLLRPLFGSGGEPERLLARYDSPRLASLLEEAAAEKSWSRRIALFKTMDAVLKQDQPAVPLFTEEERMAVRGAVRGLRPPALGWGYLDGRELWLDRREPRP